MTLTRWLVAGGLAAVLLAPQARAGDEQEAKSAGTVKKLDASTGEITLAEGRGGSKLTVVDGTEIWKDGRRAKFSDIQEGDEVRASLSSSGDPRTVNRLEVMSGRDPFYHPSHDSP